ncbi:hypothetical protein L7F22_004829 [Adiantum nelumboides]|nr:hypothetical protein [Adiantum nelumboides]
MLLVEGEAFGSQSFPTKREASPRTPSCNTAEANVVPLWSPGGDLLEKFSMELFFENLGKILHSLLVEHFIGKEGGLLGSRMQESRKSVYCSFHPFPPFLDKVDNVIPLRRILKYLPTKIDHKMVNKVREKKVRS